MMRFLVGLIAGAALVVSLKTAPGPNKLLDSATALLGCPVHIDSPGQGSDIAGPPDVDQTIHVEPAEAGPVEPGNIAGSGQVADGESTEVRLPDALVEALVEAPAEALVENPVEAPVKSPSGPAVGAPGHATESAGRLFQVAWTPFHSETSARGFASKLGSQLKREFRVIKVAPGRYEVGFHFTNDPDRVGVLEAITALTGFTPSWPPKSARI